MRERFLSPRVWIAVVVVAAIVVLSARLLDADDSRDPCADPTAAPRSELARMPDGLSFDGIGTVTRVFEDRRHVTVLAVTRKPLDEVTVLIQDAVTAAGYRPAGMDNEGFEAEVFFTTGSFAAGQARVQRSVCKGRWDVYLVLLDTGAGRSETTPTTTTG